VTRGKGSNARSTRSADNTKPAETIETHIDESIAKSVKSGELVGTAA